MVSEREKREGEETLERKTEVPTNRN